MSNNSSGSNSGRNRVEVPEAKGYSSKIAACVTENTGDDDEDMVGAKF